MNAKTSFRVFVLGLLVLVLGIPPQAFTAAARQQEGPQTPPPEEAPIPPAPPSGQQKTQPAPQTPPPQTSISVESNEVNVDVTVTNEEGDILNGFQRQNFRILDDGQPQQVTNFAPTEAPITVVILMEFSKIMGGFFGYKAREWAYGFLDHLNDKDWVALKTFDIKTTVQVDFTHNRSEVQQAIVNLIWPDFSEANVFDAVSKRSTSCAMFTARKPFCFSPPDTTRSASTPLIRP